jgi:hypothetical protein
MTSKLKKTILIFSILTLAVGALFITMSLLSTPPKNIISNPNDPKFNPMEFSLENYVRTSDAIPVLVKMFPAGTEKTYVEGIIVQMAGARTAIYRDRTVAYYLQAPLRFETGINLRKCKSDWVFEVQYDQKNRVEKLRFPCF